MQVKSQPVVPTQDAAAAKNQQRGELVLYWKLNGTRGKNNLPRGQITCSSIIIL